ncbi:uncharacterized protein [Palaemon carinicauda]|uniref:uncharacterized protein n=1 Tax=Palaemon carinicauda TaxID=392227 RepID=UPI0035B5BDA3
MNPSTILVLGLTVAGVSSALTPGFGGYGGFGGFGGFGGSGVPKTNPWMSASTSMCPPGDTPMACQAKKTKCSGVRKAFTGPGGPVGSVIECANATGVAPDPIFYMSIGIAFAKGTPEILADQISPSPTAAKSIKQCTLNATGLLNPDSTFNKTTLANTLTTGLPEPGMNAAVLQAVYTCPEPKDFQVTDYINCITTACINSADALKPAGALKPF